MPPKGLGLDMVVLSVCMECHQWRKRLAREEWKDMSNAPRHSASVEYCTKYWSSRRRQRQSQQRR